MQLSNLDIDIGTFADGAAEALFQDGLEQIIRNISDHSRPWKGARKLTITVELSPNENRDTATVKIKQTLKLVDPKPAEALVYIAVNSDGSVAATEAERPRQMTIEPEPTTIKIERVK